MAANRKKLGLESNAVPEVKLDIRQGIIKSKDQSTAPKLSKDQKKKMRLAEKEGATAAISRRLERYSQADERYLRKLYWEERLRTDRLEMDPTTMWLFLDASIKSLPARFISSRFPLDTLTSAPLQQTYKEVNTSQYHSNRKELAGDFKLLNNNIYTRFTDDEAWGSLIISCKELYRNAHSKEFEQNPLNSVQIGSLNHFIKTIQKELRSKWFFQGQNWNNWEKGLLIVSVISLASICYNSTIILSLSQEWFKQRSVLGNISTGCSYGSKGEYIASCADFYVPGNYRGCSSNNLNWGDDKDQHQSECNHGIKSVCIDPCNVLNNIALQWGGAFTGLFVPAMGLFTTLIWLLCKGFDDCRRSVSERFPSVSYLSAESQDAGEFLEDQLNEYFSAPNNRPMHTLLQEARLLALKAPEYDAKIHSEDFSTEFHRFKQSKRHGKSHHLFLENKQSWSDRSDADEVEEIVVPWYKRWCCSSRRS